MEGDRQPLLSELRDRRGGAEHAAAGRNQDVLEVPGVDGRRDHRVDRAGGRPVEAIGQDGFDDGPFQEREGGLAI